MIAHPSSSQGTRILSCTSPKNRGYYTVTGRYEFCIGVVKTKSIFTNECSEWVKCCFCFFVFLPWENKIHVFKLPCNFLFTKCMYTRVILHKQQCKSRKLCHRHCLRYNKISYIPPRISAPILHRIESILNLYLYLHCTMHACLF